MNQSPQPGSFESMSLFEKMELMERLALIPAMSLILSTRCNVGWRLANSLWTALAFFLMLAVAAFCKPEHRPGFLAAFAAFMVYSAIVHRFRRWREFRKGKIQHSYYLGDPGYEGRLIPRFIRRNRKLARFLDPVLYLGLGVWAFPYLPALGGWVVFSAICLSIVEGKAHRQLLHEKLDMVDGLVTSDIQSATVDRFSPPPDRTPQQSGDSGIPTGLGSDIQDKIKRRKAKRS